MRLIYDIQSISTRVRHKMSTTRKTKSKEVASFATDTFADT